MHEIIRRVHPRERRRQRGGVEEIGCDDLRLAGEGSTDDERLAGAHQAANGEPGGVERREEPAADEAGRPGQQHAHWPSGMVSMVAHVVTRWTADEPLEVLAQLRVVAASSSTAQQREALDERAREDADAGGPGAPPSGG